ncbi:CPBP family intramembrane metalloprotease [Balneolaceae bacterium YR4-1]|uniref:CPBP family intramembrane metalloprotease n=1 Tax=Halalkalibaculum roseum TaxID=2709311 RepID=A0A6M1TBX0_9BACT|nr:CPBP family intramembrane glutamic endopeptidase [Halalkalibaculum roseum]NGP77613.1 CPBP family intramembrane metalloprotease [Halalkalibaculum roseum]
MSEAPSRSRLKSYFNSTHTLLYSYLISLPLLLLYEILIFVAQPDTEQVVRISVDVWIKTLFSYFGQDVLSITLIFVALIGIFVLYKERNKLGSLKAGYFMTMLIEASAYAFILALLISTTVSGLLQIAAYQTVESLSTLQQLALSLGAGLYEELFFRVILVGLLLLVLKYMVQTKWLRFALAMVIAALLFSAVHYIGDLGDTFTLSSFLFRFLFGLALNAIYIFRGFGMAAWTHAIYDLMVVAFL